jgi:CheY-like chemotaxis protein
MSPTFAAFHPDQSPLRVLVADDYDDMRYVLQRWFEEAGARVASAANGREVSRLLKQETFDLVVTDVLMPDGDGLEVIAEVRRIAPKTRLIAISGGGSHLPGSDCLKFAKWLGAHALLIKPFARDELFNAITAVFADALT